ncbi:hypothetical protein HDU97_000488 [Phlyctochytrium planicorne]|nr:hypothetical protein HDU97_000488 [Phlyctochytrium planicorne]
MPKATVAATRQKPPVELYYEMHGTGLNVAMQSWDYQYEYFGSLPEYSAVAFDNRGVGLSDAPLGRYTTSDMAKDAYDLLMWIGWKSGVHVVGVSMGGMIAQELALLAPKLVSSLTLISTHAGLSLPPTSALYNVPKLLMLRDMNAKLNGMKDLLFPPEWLNGQSKDGSGRTNGEIIFERMVKRSQKTRVQAPAGAIGQLMAVMTHYVSSSRLSQLASLKIPTQVITGTWDNLIHPTNSDYIAQKLGVKVKVFDGAGHALPSEMPDEFNVTLKAFVESIGASTVSLDQQRIAGTQASL